MSKKDDFKKCLFCETVLLITKIYKRTIKTCSYYKKLFFLTFFQFFVISKTNTIEENTTKMKKQGNLKKQKEKKLF